MAQVSPAQYQAANYQFGIRANTLMKFPRSGKPITINLPFRLTSATFAPDGKSLYAITNDNQGQGSISKIEFNPIRVTVMASLEGIITRSFAVSSHQDKVVVSGDRLNAGQRSCGVFEILLPQGAAKQLASSNCRDQWRWDNLSLSPDAEQGVVTAGSNRNRDLHLELLDLAHGTVRSLGSDVYIGVWSPDGKWIVARANGNGDKLFLIDANDVSRRRPLGHGEVMAPAWSPDSRYLLLWKDCGSPGPDSTATLETLDIQSGKRTAVLSSRCQIYHGTTGWMSEEIAR